MDFFQRGLQLRKTTAGDHVDFGWFKPTGFWGTTYFGGFLPSQVRWMEHAYVLYVKPIEAGGVDLDGEQMNLNLLPPVGRGERLFFAREQQWLGTSALA